MNRQIIVTVAVLLLALPVWAQTTAFNYQGNLSDNGQQANGNYDFEFRLYDSVAGTTQIGNVITKNSVSVTDGVFSVSLDFGNEFPGSGRWLEIRVRQGMPNANESLLGAFTTLAPRQPVNSSPYSIKSVSAVTANTAESASTATNAAQLGGISANQYVLTTDPRLEDERPPTPGSADYIQNTTAEQPSTDFNISGTGKAAVLEAQSHFSIAGFRVLGVSATNLFVGNNTGGQSGPGVSNTHVGYQAGLAAASGSYNTNVGTNAGYGNLGSNNSFYGSLSGWSINVDYTGSFNSYFGFQVGRILADDSSRNSIFGSNDKSFVEYSAGSRFDNSIFGFNAAPFTRSSRNSLFGARSGEQLSTGGDNSFFGYKSGNANTTGNFNSFFGTDAGKTNTVGIANLFLGFRAGRDNLDGNANSFVGYAAGVFNTSGRRNTFVGHSAGDFNTTGESNTSIGFNSDVGSSNLTFATAIGSEAVVSASNTIQLGRDGLDKVRIGRLSSTQGTTPLCQNASKEVATCNLPLLLGTAPAQNNLFNKQKNEFSQLREVINRQQAEIDELKRQQSQFEALRKLVFSQYPDAVSCKASEVTGNKEKSQ